MKHSKWQNVDNVANLFLATYNNRDTRTMRICCVLKERVDPCILQLALDETVRIRPQFQVRLHKGIFWRYIEDSTDLPVVTEEKGRVCPLLFFHDRPEQPLYKVTYWRNRINLDMFHAIGDGTGAMEFMNIMITEYLKAKYDDVPNDYQAQGEETPEQLSENSFKSNFDKESEPISDGVKQKKAYRPYGRKIPYEQLQFFELHLSAVEVLKKAKEYGVNLSSYIGAAMMLALLQDMPASRRKEDVTISMPVNLRNYYESSSMRNFFNSINISHSYQGGETLASLCAEYLEKMRESLKPDNIKRQMNYFQNFQQKWPIRIVPLAIKELGILLAAKQSYKHISAIVSNIGEVKLPEELSRHIEYYSAYCSSEYIFIVLCGFKDKMTISISYPYSDTRILRRFIKILREDDIAIRLYATEVVR